MSIEYYNASSKAVLTFIYRLCENYNVLKYFILNDPELPFEIEIFGVNATVIPEEDLKMLMKEFSDYTITTLDQEDAESDQVLYADQFMLEPPVIDKFLMQGRKWKCEFIISALDSNQVFILLTFDFKNTVYSRR